MSEIFIEGKWGLWFEILRLCYFFSGYFEGYMLDFCLNLRYFEVRHRRSFISDINLSRGKGPKSFMTEGV